MFVEESRDRLAFLLLWHEANVASSSAMRVDMNSVPRQFFRQWALLRNADPLMGACFEGEVELHALPAQNTGSSRDEEDVSCQVGDFKADSNPSCHIVPEPAQLVVESQS